MMIKKVLINSLKRGDSVLIDYTKELNKYEDEDDLEREITTKLSLVLEVTEDKIKFKDSNTPYPFEYSKKYLLNSDLELTLIEQ